MFACVSPEVPGTAKHQEHGRDAAAEHLPSAHADVPRKMMKYGKEIYLLISRTVDKKI